MGLWVQLDLERPPLLRLLLREHDLEQGDIFLNGISIKDYRLQDLRSLIGYVPQDQILFAMTIRENVAFRIRRSRKKS